MHAPPAAHRFLFNDLVTAESYLQYGMAQEGFAQFLHCRTPGAALKLTFTLSTAVLGAYATSNPGQVGPQRSAVCKVVRVAGQMHGTPWQSFQTPPLLPLGPAATRPLHHPRHPRHPSSHQPKVCQKDIRPK